MAPAPKKVVLRALRKLPGKGGKAKYSPSPGEAPFIVLRVQVIGCKDLLAEDRNGFSDPFVVVSVLSNRQQTPVQKRTLNPVYAAKDATFDFPLYQSLADVLGAVEFVIWDKDMLKKDYLGEVALSFDSCFKGGKALGFDDPDNKPFEEPVISTRKSKQSKGTIQVKLGFVASPASQEPPDFDALYRELIKRSRPSIVSVNPTEGIGTIRSHEAGSGFQDDGGISSDEEYEEDDDGSLASSLPPTIQTAVPSQSSTLLTPTTPTMLHEDGTGLKSHDHLVVPGQAQSVQGETGSSATTPTPASTKGKAKLPKLFPRRSTSGQTTPTINNPGVVDLGSASLPGSGPLVQSPGVILTPKPVTQTNGEFSKKMKFVRAFSSTGKKKEDYNLNATNDIVGIVMLEVLSASDLPRLKNMTRTNWDMDPFVVISFGKKVFRTRVIRHSLNPVWEEKLLFHVREFETAFKVQLSLLDWDKLSSNDHVGDTGFDLKELVECAPQPDPATGLYEVTGGDHDMKELNLPIVTDKDAAWEAKNKPILKLRAKYQPYDALRQNFWRQYLKQYDTDDTNTVSHLELTSMLDSLGSTLTKRTIESFFTRNNKKPETDDLSFEETILCLETELGRPKSEKRRVDTIDTDDPPSGANTPTRHHSREGPPLEGLDFSGQHMFPPEHAVALGSRTEKPGPPTQVETTSNVEPLHEVAYPSAVSYLTPGDGFERSYFGASSDTEESSGSSDHSLERVINVKNCPLCHRPRLNSKAEVDIVTHLAVCASQDWSKVNRIMVGNYVTASQAQRKWFAKVISKVSSGDYKLGANSANIIVQNRMTGQLEEEKMQVYVRLGIRILYKGAKSRMEGNRARKLLKSMSIKQGIKYDAPESARDIPGFVHFHNLPVDEILDPLSSFKTFNEFFYRKLKPEARPVENVDDPNRLVSGADCRLMAFETVSEATRLWIKGREFTVARLLGDSYKSEVEKYNGGALCIFRLAPQDYHRFHSPVDGTIGPITEISGEYYTVNPQAIRTALDVYGENVRTIVPINSPRFGRVMAVCIGAMMVGSIKITVKEGDKVARGQEFGYFAFGGSTIVTLFERGVVEWDEDLLINGRACLETLVRVGMGIGKSVKN